MNTNSYTNYSSIIQVLYDYPVYLNVSLHPCPPRFKLTDTSPYTCVNVMFYYKNLQEYRLPYSGPDSGAQWIVVGRWQ